MEKEENPKEKKEKSSTACGGDYRDLRDQKEWNYEFQNNPIYSGYR